MMNAILARRAEHSASGSDMTTVSATWSYVLPSLNYIMRDPPQVPHPDNKAPVLPVVQHAGVYSQVYNFATSARSGGSGMPAFGTTGATGMRQGFDSVNEAFLDKFQRVRAMIGYELYSLLEDYFRDLAREIRMNAPLPPHPSTSHNPSSANKAKGKKSIAPPALGDEFGLLEYYVRAYNRYSTGAAQINRLFAYLNRHFVLRAIDEGCGWISLADVVAASVLKDLAAVSISKPTRRDLPPPSGPLPMSSLTTASTSKKSKEELRKLEARKHTEWRKWGYDATNAGTSEQRRIAELCAEAAAGVDRIITIGALAMRSWRLEVAEPLLNATLWNSNGESAGWAGTAPIPPTPLPKSRSYDPCDCPSDQDCPHIPDSPDLDHPVDSRFASAHHTFNLPIVIPPPKSSSNPPVSDPNGKGKGKSKSTHYDAGLAMSLPVHVPMSTSANGKVSPNGRISPIEGELALDGTSIVPPANGQHPKKKRPGPRKGLPNTGSKMSLAAVRASVKAQSSDQASAETMAPPKARLSRAVTLMLETPTVVPSQPDLSPSLSLTISSETVTPMVKTAYAMAVADSLKMCGVSPDNGVRRRLDRYLLKVGKGEGQ